MMYYGGYLEIENESGTDNYHKNALVLKNGRSSLNYILSITKPKHIYIPYYCCNTLLEPIIENKIDYSFYEIDSNLKPTLPAKLKSEEIILYINYFGIKTGEVKRLASFFSSQLIVDNTHAFFDIGGTDYWSFNSARKFFGVPDGSFLYPPKAFKITQPKFSRNTTYITKHLFLRKKEKVKEGYVYFKENESLQNPAFELCSQFTENILLHISYKKVAAKRIQNFDTYASRFGKINKLMCSLLDSDVPIYYPLLIEKRIDRNRLIKNNIFTPVLWEECRNRLPGYTYEKYLTDHMIPLPLDQRYSTKDIENICNIAERIIYE